MHESVAEVIDSVVIDGHEIPWLVLQDPSGGIVDRAILSKNLGECLEPLVPLLIDLGGARNPGRQMFPAVSRDEPRPAATATLCRAVPRHKDKDRRPKCR